MLGLFNPNSRNVRILRSLTLLMAVMLGANVAIADTKQPNVVIILADDLGWNDVGYHGSEIKTPHLDQLAQAGVVLEHYHSQPTCTPTRAALLTGKSPQRLGIYRQFAKNAVEGLPTEERTLADLLRAHGYQTWLTGKWHLGHARPEFLPNARGFDHFYGHVTGGIGYWDHVHGGGLDWQRNGATVRENGYSTHLLAQEAIKKITQRDTERPFFLYASFNAPHLPNEAPQAALDAYVEMASPQRRLHAAMVSELDRAIGQIVATLSAEQILDNTLIWFMSDNGGLNPQAGLGGFLSLAETLDAWFDPPVPITFLEFIRTNALDGGADNTPLREGKGSIYQGGVRVPSVVHFPNQLTSSVQDAFITVQDVLPTLLDATGINVPADLDGRSRWKTLQSQTEPQAPNYYVTMGQQGTQAFYRWPWKLLETDDGYALYDLSADPLEQHDLAAAESARVMSMAADLDNIPRAENLHIPIYKVIWDPDFFGGTEDRPPWAELAREKETQ